MTFSLTKLKKLRFFILSGLNVQITTIPIENIIPETVYSVFTNVESSLTLKIDDIKIERTKKPRLRIIFFFMF